MILYINKSYCSSLEQLRGYFKGQIDINSDIYWDLLESGRSHDISNWLQERGETDLACRLEKIDYELGDSAFFAEMCKVILDEEIQTPTRPEFSQCYSVENVQHEVTETGATVFVYLKVLMSLNEKYELKVQTNWGTCVEFINSFYSKTDEVIKKEFKFRKQPNRDFSEIRIFVDSKPLSRTLVGACDKKEFTVNGVSFNMIRVEHGAFMMGATKEQMNPERDELPVCQVKLTNDYYIGETLVTQRLWGAIMGGNPSYFKGEDKPMENISWNDCQGFIHKLNEFTGMNFDLPTEAEWEFAARGGNKSNHTQFSGSCCINDVAWFSGNSFSKTHAVAKKRPNELGIYDMNGNVLEWCKDWYGMYDEVEHENPKGPNWGSQRVCRGGAFFHAKKRHRLSYRHSYFPSYRGNDVGFRLCIHEESLIPIVESARAAYEAANETVDKASKILPQLW
ncbi:MAG: formylglycine-generating enzyme family protein [Paraprevotella sp.]|nr:formylglycine-generating enzyme family protein [Paraprevotella sp.]